MAEPSTTFPVGSTGRRKIIVGVASACALIFAVVFATILLPRFLYLLEHEGSAEWGESSICRDKNLFQVHTGLSKQQVLRHFSEVHGYRIGKKSVDWAERIRGLKRKPKLSPETTPVEEWTIVKRGATESITIYFNAKQRMIGATCGNA